MEFPADPIAAVTHPDPYPYYRWLSAEKPFAFDQSLGLWVAASAETVGEVLADVRLSVRPAGEPIPQAISGTAAGRVFGELARMNEGARHAEARGVVTTRLAEWNDARMTQMIEEVWPLLPSKGIDAVMWCMPVFALARGLGVASRDIPMVATCVKSLVAAFAPGASTSQVEAGSEAADRLRALLETGIPPAAVANCIGILTQDFEATAGLIGNALLALARNRIAIETAGMELMEETARWDGAVQNTRRYVNETSLIMGQEVPAGSCILVLLAAANHDARANSNPELFLPDRKPRRIFTFGSARHECAAGRLSLALTLEALRRLEPHATNAAMARFRGYRQSANLRIPVFAED